jgi:hypothetical protein
MGMGVGVAVGFGTVVAARVGRGVGTAVGTFVRTGVGALPNGLAKASRTASLPVTTVTGSSTANGAASPLFTVMAKGLRLLTVAVAVDSL